MATYATQEWCDLFKEALNKNTSWSEAAKTWEGDFYFVIEAGGAINKTRYMYVDLWHGVCRAAEMVTDFSKYKPEFVLQGPYPIWKRVSTKQLDSTQAIITKQFKLTGNMAKIMRYTKAANELTNTTSKVQTEWEE
ncbi:MAG: SCP2 sterol-binding domain-containing protein [Dehalococcoidia bacterium]